jgi:hypothetical protein
MFDCRNLPGQCTLAISGEEDEVVEAQVLHAVQIHGQADSPQLRAQIRAALKEAPGGA